MSTYIYKDNEQLGPFTMSQLHSLWNSGAITSDSLYWREGLKDWRRLGNFGHSRKIGRIVIVVSLACLVIAGFAWNKVVEYDRTSAAEIAISQERSERVNAELNREIAFIRTQEDKDRLLKRALGKR